MPTRKCKPTIEQTPSSGSVARMREGWRKFARADPMFYISVDRHDWTKAEFFATGRDLVAEVLAWAGPDLPRERMLEIGCGMGRLLVHFAGYFQQVEGVDIAPEMIEEAEASGLPENVQVAVSSGRDLAAYGDSELDFVFSFIVFQHIPDQEVIASYLEEVGRVLRPPGKAVLQFDTRPSTVISKLVFSLPDFMLPRTRRRYIRRYRRDPQELAKLVERARLAVNSERGRGTERHFLLLSRTLG